MRTQRTFISVGSVALGLLLLAGACSSSDSADPPGTTVSTSATASAATVSTAGEAIFTPILASVIAPPIPVPTTDGKIHLAYELFLTNAVGQEITVDSITAESEGTTLQELSGATLPTSMKVLGTTEPTAVFGPGQSAIVWMDVVVDTEADVPATIEHVIDITPSTPSPPVIPATLSEKVAPTTVSDQEPIVIAPPVSGDNWLDGNSCCEITPHRAAVNPLNGAFWVPERFAIDYVQLDADDRLYTGPIDRFSSWAFYGAELTAVAPGKVVAVVDGLPEQTPGANPTGLPVAEYGGNHVVQDIGNGHYAFYAHIQNGTTRVEVGDELGTGEVVGLLGNSGNTDAPHLHFHVMDGPDPLASNGLPFVFSSFTLLGTMTDDASVGELLATGGPAALTPGSTSSEETDVMPLYRDLMDYPGS